MTDDNGRDGLGANSDDDVVMTPEPRSKIQSGLSWNAASQFASVGVNLGLTPFLLLKLGVDRFGVFALISSFRGLLSNLDGGLGPTSNRYFSVYAGARDRRSTSALLVTISALLIIVVGLLGGIVAILAPHITVVLHASPKLHHSATKLLRAFMPLLLVSSLRMVFQRIVISEHRWAFFNAVSTGSMLCYAIAAVVLVGGGGGLFGLLWANVVQEGLMFVALAVGASRSVALRELRFMSWAEVKDILRYASRVQIAAVASSFNYEIDSLIVGLLFPVRFVGFYSIGANVSGQLVSLPTNALTPIAVTLSRAFGRSNLRSTIDEFTVLQRIWVRSIAAFPLIGAVSVYFGMLRWLGPSRYLAGVIASILLVGNAASLLSQVMDVFGKSVKRPGIESRYLALGMVVNIALTIPLALTIGVLGVPIGTALGTMASTAYFLRIARREIDPDIRSFLADVPVLAVLASVAVTAALELPAYLLAPEGAAGMVVCGIPAAIGLATYAVLILGWHESIRWVGHRFRGAPLAARLPD